MSTKAVLTQGFKYLETSCWGEEHHRPRPLHSKDFAGAEASGAATSPPCWALSFDFPSFIGTLVSVCRKISGWKTVWYVINKVEYQLGENEKNNPVNLLQEFVQRFNSTLMKNIKQIYWTISEGI